jgi:hypothetical protein
MMKNSVKPILSLSLAAALAFGLTGCNNEPEPAPSPTSSSVAPTATPKPTPDVSGTTSPSATPNATSSVPATAESELQEAQAAFPNVKVNEGENKEQIQLALLGAQRYVNTVYNSGYLANGSWVKNGADSQELVKLFGKDWSDSYRLKLEALIDDYKNGNEEIKNQASRDLIVHFFYFDNSGGMTLPKDCNTAAVGVSSCLLDEKLESDTELTYQYNKVTGSIYVNTRFTANVRFIKDGVQGVSPVQYDVQLEMIKNPHPDAENLRYTYIVNDIGGSWNIENWHEGE